MKCHICGVEMENTIGGCYTCRNCGMGGINDCVLRVPVDKIIKSNTQNIIDDEKIVCYNCGKECIVEKCPNCGVKTWQCECGYGFGHSCTKKEKK